KQSANKTEHDENSSLRIDTTGERAIEYNVAHQNTTIKVPQQQQISSINQNILPRCSKLESDNSDAECECDECQGKVWFVGPRSVDELVGIKVEDEKVDVQLKRVPENSQSTDFDRNRDPKVSADRTKANLEHQNRDGVNLEHDQDDA